MTTQRGYVMKANCAGENVAAAAVSQRVREEYGGVRINGKYDESMVLYMQPRTFAFYVYQTLLHNG